MTTGWTWTGATRPPWAEEPDSGEESVWDFPRPPRIEPVDRPVRVEHRGVTLASTDAALRVVETAGAPVYYVPPDDVLDDALGPGSGYSACEWKGRAVYHDITVQGELVRRAAWRYPDPLPGYETIRDHVAFYASKLDGCWVGDERVRGQPGGFYGGWVTSDLAGPIKGRPGTEHW